MKIRIPRQEIRRILGGRYENLHREFLGIDISGRGVDPIDRNVYYVSYLDAAGWGMYWNDAPAMCDFHDGAIYCYHNPALPLTEVRLVHEFIHRAARFRPSIGVWSSGVVVGRPWVKVNEGLTEYLTSLLVGQRYVPFSMRRCSHNRLLTSTSFYGELYDRLQACSQRKQFREQCRQE